MEKYCGGVCILQFAEKGFKFEPSAQQICGTYLKLKIEGKKLPCKHLIFDENLYEEHSIPWEIFRSDDPRWLVMSTDERKSKKVMYVFTELKKKGERVLRKGGCGTWTNQNKKEVRNEGGGVVIGYDKLHTFKISSDEKKKKGERGNWTMHEYSLHPNDYGYAVCKITKEEAVRDKFDEQPSTKKCSEELFTSTDDVALEDLQNMYQEDLVLDQEWESFTETLEEILQEPQEEQPSMKMCSEEVASTTNVALEDFSQQNVYQEDLVQEGPLLDQEWECFTETLEEMLQEPQEKEACDEILQEPRQEERGACDDNSLGTSEFPIEIDDALENEDLINVIAQPQGIDEDTRTDDKYYSDNIASDPKEPGESQVLLAEQEQQAQETERMACISNLAANFDYYYNQQQQQEQQPQESERMAVISHLEENFNYYYKQQQQQQLEVEGSLKNSSRKRKNCVYDHEEEYLCSKKKQLQSFLCSLQ